MPSLPWRVSVRSAARQHDFALVRRVARSLRDLARDRSLDGRGRGTPERSKALSDRASARTRPFEPIGDRRFRILSLDGGGIKGTFTASVLATIEEMSDKNVAEHFDLIVGTSTGGIIALALGLGLPAHRIRDLYVKNGPQIFGATGVRGSFRRFFRAKHDSRRLREALNGEFGARRLGESTTRLVIPSFNVVSGAVHLFKTSHHPRFKRDYLWKVKDVAMATSAAPTYFSIFHHEESGLRLVDGGVWANNPVAVGVNEAIGVLGCARDGIEVLSIGTTGAPFHVKPKKRHGGLLGWGRGSIRLLMEAQTQGMAGLAHAITQHDRRLLRIDPTVAPGRFSLDDPKQISELGAVGEEAAKHAERRVHEHFLDEPAPTFEPYRVLSAETRS